MANKVIHKFKKHFIPCEENNHKPPFLKSNFLLYVVLGLFIIKIALICFTVYFPNSALFAAVNRSTLISLTNQQRVSAGLNALAENSQLNSAASMKANDMLQDGYFAHTSPDGKGLAYWISAAGYNYRYAGENLAIDFLDSSEIFNAWMASSSHRANIFNSNFRDIGMAVVSGNFNGNPTTVVVQMFGSTGVTTSGTSGASTTTTRKTTTTRSTTTTTQKKTTAPASTATGPSLLSYYAQKGQPLPSLEERAALFAKFGLGSADSYNGTAEQNALLLAKLLESDKAQQATPAPTPTPTPSPTQTLTPEQTRIIKEAEKIVQQPIFPAGRIMGVQIENNSFKFKILDFLANYSHMITQGIFLTVLVIVLISFGLSVFVKAKIQHRDLILRGVLYTLILLILFLLDKAVIIKMFPHSIGIL